MKIQLNDTNGSKVTKKTVCSAIKEFIRNTPTDHEIKILAIVLMAHGGENAHGSPDW